MNKKNDLRTDKPTEDFQLDNGDAESGATKKESRIVKATKADYNKGFSVGTTPTNDLRAATRDKRLLD